MTDSKEKEIKKRKVISQQKYRKKIDSFCLRFNNNEYDLFDHMHKQTNKTQYLISLLRDAYNKEQQKKD